MTSDWLRLWRDLVEVNYRQPSSGSDRMVKRFKGDSRKKAERPDSLLDFVLKSVSHDITVLDIGAGTGRWTIPLAKVARSVTAVEPSAGMMEMLRANIEDAGLSNVTTILAPWEEATVEPHDIIVSAHSIYGVADLEGFMRKVEQKAKKACYIALRLPPADGIIGELSRIVHGCFHDSPNAIVAFNALYSMGIYANVLVEESIEYWTDETLEKAICRAKRHLNLESSTAYDGLIRDTLARRLIHTGIAYKWPDGMRSALLWWNKLADK